MSTLTTPNALAAAYAQDGFVLLNRPMLDASLIAEAGAGMDAVMRGEYDTGRAPDPSPWKPGDDPSGLCKIEMPQNASRLLRKVISQPVIGEMAARVTGASLVQVWWVQLLHKPPTPRGATTATRIGWHQDRTYWGCWDNEQGLLTAWLAVSDVTQDAGPMLFVPGSHRWGLLPDGDFTSQEELRGKIRVPAGQTWREAPAVLPPGGLSLHHSLTLHGSALNHSGRPRRSLAIHLRTNLAEPVGRRREGLTRYIDDLDLCPVVHRAAD